MDLERELLIYADFNALDDQGRVKASLRFAGSPEIPRKGEWVRLADSEENTCLGRVEDMRDLVIAVRVDPATWVPGRVLVLDHQF
jgi:hypothetical protein